MIGVRTFIGGNGADTTNIAMAFLRSATKVRFADLVLIGDLTDTAADFLTDWETSLCWPIKGTFKPSVISRGSITSQVGLEVDHLELKWSPAQGTPGNTIATATKYQLAQMGFYDHKEFHLFRAPMDIPGDVNTMGATEYFGGWVAHTRVEEGQITFTIESFLNVLGRKIPLNTIASTSMLAGYSGATPVLVDGETNIPRFSIVAGSRSTVLLADCLSPTAAKIYGNNKLARGYVYFDSGSLKGVWSAIGTNSNYNAGAGVHHNQIQIYSPLPWPPAVGDTFYVSTQRPPLAGDYAFLYVPGPTESI